jgi:ABC-type nitrate/sulfonate/bicarbonate transport system substrate-binding protein
MRQASGLRTIAGISVLAIFAFACSSPASSADTGRSVVRFAFSPDPVIDWMNDQGIIPEYEDQYNVRLVTSSTWDEFTFFAGGHGDVVSMATYETPILEKETGIKTVTFGAYNNLRVPVFVGKDSTAQTLEDLVGKKIGVPSAVSSTIVWGMFAKKLHDLDFRVGEGDFDLVIGDHFVNMDLLVRGELDACLCIPEAAFPHWRVGDVRALYDERPPWMIYRDEFAEGHKGLNGNNFVARADWYDAHPNEVQFFLALWERGIKEWQANYPEIMATYPQHFSVEDEADVEFAVQYMKDYDFFAPTVYLDEEWIKNETNVYTLMKETGFMEADAEVPRFEVVTPAEPGN